VSHVDADMARVLAGNSIALSFITVGELWLWAEVRSWEYNRDDFEDFWRYDALMLVDV
jgi:hypothetical protein